MPTPNWPVCGGGPVDADALRRAVRPVDAVGGARRRGRVPAHPDGARRLRRVLHAQPGAGDHARPGLAQMVVIRAGYRRRGARSREVGRQRHARRSCRRLSGRSRRSRR